MKNSKNCFDTFEKNWDFFLRKMSHSAENTKEYFMLAKRFVCNKSRGGFDKNKLESRIVPKKGS